MQKVILSTFAPFIIAIAIRAVPFIIAIILRLGELIFHIQGFTKTIGVFDIFSWDESYFYWIIVIIATLNIEMLIWTKSNKS